VCDEQAAGTRPDEPQDATAARLARLEAEIARAAMERAALWAQVKDLRLRETARADLARFLRGDTGGFPMIRPNLEIIPGTG